MMPVNGRFILFSKPAANKKKTKKKKKTTTKQQLCSGTLAKILQVEILLLFCSHVASHSNSNEHKSQWHPSEQQCDI
jgi:hypothetical protein